MKTPLFLMMAFCLGFLPQITLAADQGLTPAIWGLEGKCVRVCGKARAFACSSYVARMEDNARALQDRAFTYQNVAFRAESLANMKINQLNEGAEVGEVNKDLQAQIDSVNEAWAINKAYAEDVKAELDKSVDKILQYVTDLEKVSESRKLKEDELKSLSQVSEEKKCYQGMKGEIDNFVVKVVEDLCHYNGKKIANCGDGYGLEAVVAGQ